MAVAGPWPLGAAGSTRQVLSLLGGRNKVIPTDLNKTDLPSPSWEARGLGWGCGLAAPTEGLSLACPRSWGSCRRGSKSRVLTQRLLVRILCPKTPFPRTAAIRAQGPVPA